MLPDYSDKKINVVFIGCGSVSGYHFDVFNSLGVNVTAASARVRSRHLAAFTSKRKIRSYDNNKELIEKEKPDAIVVLSSWANTSIVMDEIISYELPMLVEKPVALGVNKIKNWMKKHPKSRNNVQIGYNRRFYDFIPEVKNWIDNEEITSVEVHIPERFQDGLNKKRMDEAFMSNSSHVIDLLYFLLGKKAIQVEAMIPHKKGKQGYNGVLSGVGKLPIHLIANWGSPSNFGLVFHGLRKKLVMSPIEEVHIYDGFSVNDSPHEGMKSYVPTKVQSYFIDAKEKFKPGFLGQTINFIETAVLKNIKNTQGCTLKDALHVTKIMEDITKFK